MQVNEGTQELGVIWGEDPWRLTDTNQGLEIHMTLTANFHPNKERSPKSMSQSSGDDIYRAYHVSYQLQGLSSEL